MEEAKWVHEKKVPTMEEFMQVGLITSTIPLLSVVSLLGLGNFAIKDVFDWVLNYPKLVTASSIIYRFIDDIITHEYEKETRGQEATSVQCYMKQHGVTKQEAIDELYRQISNAWKDINEECLKPFTVPFPVLKRIIGLVRVASVVYKDGDGYTFSQLLLKDDIASLLVDPLPVSVSDI
ncbi:hypothetical protein COLO4_09457 [Corchorus olitorius]|uniref:Terpene synthase metal-binding domain-containing protein n=1 Tax=Corchorus olitorius TaxID=93759 RepID=A0A1R3KC08_9ROSI|nr:hypothetical protein COLO4_09457 [Corchorus olitorius]